jgi:hypothetical protein
MSHWCWLWQFLKMSFIITFQICIPSPFLLHLPMVPSPSSGSFTFMSLFKDLDYVYEKTFDIWLSESQPQIFKDRIWIRSWAKQGGGVGRQGLGNAFHCMAEEQGSPPAWCGRSSMEADSGKLRGLCMVEEFIIVTECFLLACSSLRPLKRPRLFSFYFNHNRRLLTFEIQ